MHAFKLRNMYLRNLLMQPGGIEPCGTPIDLSAIKAPTTFVAALDDHIAPWQSVYMGARLLGGRFILGAAGHIAGIINPPTTGKYGRWLSPTDTLPADAAQWLAGARPVSTFLVDQVGRLA
jgi:polyhydroxyalkanoate synthase